MQYCTSSYTSIYKNYFVENQLYDQQLSSGGYDGYGTIYSTLVQASGSNNRK